MKRITSLSLILFSATLLPILSAHAEQEPSFKPPQLGAPETRIGGGTRAISGLKKQASKIQLLASKQIGLTNSATPTLYWYAPENLSKNVTLTIRLDENTPLLEKNLGVIKTSGIQAVHLTDYEVSLVAGQDYTWSITVESASKNSAPQLVSATIRYTPAATPPANEEADYWYDTVSNLIETQSPRLDEFLQNEGISIKTGK